MAQSLNPKDSLLKILSIATGDSIKAKTYSLLTEVCEVSEIKLYAEEVIKIANKYSNSTDLKVKYKFLGDFDELILQAFLLCMGIDHGLFSL